MGVGRERLRLGHLDLRDDGRGRSAIIEWGLGKTAARATARGEYVGEGGEGEKEAACSEVEVGYGWWQGCFAALS